MDWHKLQQTLFALDPTDPKEDLAKLRAAAQGSAVPKASETVDYLTESASVPAGSLKIDRDYSVADFAALAGVRIDERQKHGDYARGSDPMPKAKPGRTKHPLKDKLVGEEEVEETFVDAVKAGANKANYNRLGAVKAGADAMAGGGVKSAAIKAAPQQQQAQKIKSSVTGAQLGRQLGVSDPNAFNQAVMRVKQGQPLGRMHQAAMSDAFVKLMAMSPEETQRVMQLLKRSEAQTEAEKKPMPKPRDPSSQYMQDLRKSGAMGAHKDKKKDTKSGKVKHKGYQYESIKDMLYAKLAEKK